MTPTDIVGALTKFVQNPYLDTYEKTPEHELTAWKAVFEQSIGHCHGNPLLLVNTGSSTDAGTSDSNSLARRAMRPEPPLLA
ncbi:hypothetical protein SAMN05444161_7055 [Rhizobiales bacterium GAS191]|nr:hypothetical protein SAMN05444161_7055 [Rhizobiales bacterium GAS191]